MVKSLSEDIKLVRPGDGSYIGAGVARPIPGLRSSPIHSLPGGLVIRGGNMHRRRYIDIQRSERAR